MALKVLKQQAETPVQAPGNRPFPKGIWKFEIIAPTGERTRATPEFMHNGDTAAEGKVGRVAGDTGEILSVWFGNAEAAAEGQDNPGKQIFFQDFVIRDGLTEIMDLDPDHPGDAGWQIQRDARLLANLAIALGAVTFDGTYYEIAPNFVELLKAGEFDSQHIVASISHRAWTSKSGKSGTEASITQFTPAA